MTLTELQETAHAQAVKSGFWDADRNIGELLALVHSELSEALEEYRDGHKPGDTRYRIDGKPEGFGIELADAVIRLADMAQGLGVDLQELVAQKLAYNAIRPRMHGKIA